MRKTLFIILLFIIPSALFAQWTGDGLSPSTAYYGKINSSNTMQDWNRTNYTSGVVYVGREATSQYDLEIESGGHLNIGSNMTIRFCTTTSDLIISGTGVLVATGTGTNPITFTKDSNSTWGHLTFEGSGTCSLSNCIIENGRKASGEFNVESFGGGIHTSNSNLTISNSIIRNNYAVYGGGIFINSNASPSIKDCVISNNIAGTTGGGLLFYQYTASTVENCIIENNTCNGAGGGGGIFCGLHAGDVRFYNCVISSNSNPSGNGVNIRLHSNTDASHPKFYNTIVWGSDYFSSINYTFQTLASDDFNYCAIQGYPSGWYISCIDLDGTNSASNGPNFIDPRMGGDYSISFISPCRDLGTDSYNLPQDYLGNPRIGPYDIGAYEVQYNRWIGGTPGYETDWSNASNWQPASLPTTLSNVVIPDVTSDPLISVSDVTVNHLVTNIGGILNVAADRLFSSNILINKGTLTFLPNAKGTVTTIINTGTLKLNSNSSGTASLITTSYTRGTGGTEEIQLFLTGGGTTETYKWHYISSPVSSLAVSTFAPTATYNLAQWVENRPTGSLLEGWVAFDGYIYSSPFILGPTFSSLNPGKGYDFYDDADNTFTFGGLLNTGDVAMGLGYSGTPSIHGFNLLGNPFSSGLNWDDIINSVYFPYPSNTSKSLYFTKDNVQYSYIGGVGIPLGEVNGIIPPMQGFFTKTYSGSNTITLPAAARTHNNIHARYKGETIIPLIRLAITDNSMSDETVIRFDDLAKTDLDMDFDAVKMFISASKTYIYSVSSGTNYAINGQPFPKEAVEIPIVVNVTTNGNHTISTTQLEGLDNYNVTLTDKTNNNFTTDLKTTPTLAFASSAETLSDRFVLKVSKISTGIEDPVVTSNSFNIYSVNNLINIQPLADGWDGKKGSIRVLDMTGKSFNNLQDVEFRKNSILQIPAIGLKGMYIVEMRAGALRFVGKVLIR
jgi:hypothetical protein